MSVLAQETFRRRLRAAVGQTREKLIISAKAVSLRPLGILRGFLRLVSEGHIERIPLE